MSPLPKGGGNFSRMKPSPKDDLFSHLETSEKFQFNESVARVFDDMLERSVPFYQHCQNMVLELAAPFIHSDSNLYDLGCSTGTLLSRLAGSIPPEQRVQLIGVDNSPDMLAKAREKLQADGVLSRCKLVEADLESDFHMANASVVIMNYTLQFMAPDKRAAMMQKIYRALIPGGCAIIIEKVLGEHTVCNQVFINSHHEFKKSNGYSQLEITRKREALEDVLIPLKLSENLNLLKEAGFSSLDIFFKWYNFVGIIACKPV